MKTLSLQQGSPEWHEFRANHFTASDAPAMLGVSPYKSRVELMKEKKFGITKEIDAHTQRRFDEGHRFEALARPMAEEFIGEELYPVVGVSDDYPTLAASFDGITMDECVLWEHKTLNAEISSCLVSSDLPVYYRVQMEQQLLVSGAERCLFVASRWNDDNSLEDERGFWYYSDNELRQRIIAGWAQFEKDVAEFEMPEAARPEVIAAAPDAMPALFVQVKGEVLSSNIDAFRSKALAVFDNIKTEISTDEDFASAEKAVKWCKDVETRCEATKEQVIGQMASVEEVTRTLGIVQERARQTRLVLEKAVKAQKEALRIERINAAQERYAAHCDTLKTINTMTITPPRTDFASAIKGLKTLTSVDAALDAALAQGKIAANALETLVRDNLDWYGQNAAGYEALFHDLPGIVQKPAEDFQIAVNYRIDQAKKAEAARLEAERERIRKEEQAKAEAEARAKAEEEARAKARAEAEEKAQAEPAAAVAEPVAANDPHQEWLRKVLAERIAELNTEELKLAIHYVERLRAYRKEAE